MICSGIQLVLGLLWVLCCELMPGATVPDLGPFGGHHRVSSGHPLLCWVCGPLVEAVFQANSDHSLSQAWDNLMGITVQVQAGHCCCRIWGSLARGVRHSEPASHCMWIFERFQEIQQWEPREAACLEPLGEVQQELGRDSGNLGVGRTKEGSSGACRHFGPGRNGPNPSSSSPDLKPISLVPTCVSMEPSVSEQACAWAL